MFHELCILFPEINYCYVLHTLKDSGEHTGSFSEIDMGQFSVPLLSCYLALGKLIAFLEPQFPIYKNEHNRYCIKKQKGLNNRRCVNSQQSKEHTVDVKHYLPSSTPPSPAPGAPPTVKSTQVKACPVHKIIPRTPLHHLDVCEVCDDFPTFIANTGDLCFLSFQWSVLLADY